MTNYLEEPVDFNYLKEIIADDHQFEKELFDIFLENAEVNIQKMAQAIDDSYSEKKEISEPSNNKWYMASHAFKGAAGSIGAFKLSRILEKAQQCAEEDGDGKKSILQKVQDEFELVSSVIKQRESNL